MLNYKKKVKNNSIRSLYILYCGFFFIISLKYREANTKSSAASATCYFRSGTKKQNITIKTTKQNPHIRLSILHCWRVLLNTSQWVKSGWVDAQCKNCLVSQLQGPVGSLVLGASPASLDPPPNKPIWNKIKSWECWDGCLILILKPYLL